MSNEYNVGDLVAEFLHQCQVETVFGIVSIHNMPMLDAIGRRNAIRFVMTRGETGAAHMADGYARATGKLGVVFSSTGPGAANAVAGVVEARFASSPVLHITGATPIKYAGREVGAVHDMPDQIGMLRSVSKAAFRISTAEEALGVLSRAVTEAMSEPRGPVSIEVPIDIQRAKVERPSALDGFSLPTSSKLLPERDALEDLADRVVKARRPLLWLGNGAREASGPVSRLLDLGFGMVTSWAGRGVTPEDHPQNIGSFTGYGMPEVQEFYKGCDLMIVVGSRLRAHETGDFSIALPKPLLQIDIDPAANGRTYGNDGFYRGNARSTLEALVELIAGKMSISAGYVAELAELKEEVRANYRDTLGPYRDFPAALRKAVPRDAIWARDITTSNSSWGNRLFPVYGLRDNIFPISAGIGQGFPLGLGAAVGAPGRKTVILSGDGGFFLSIAELWTAVQEQLDIILVLMNDKGYGVIRQLQNAMTGGRQFYTDLQGPDVGDLARSSGIAHWRVGNLDAFEAALGEAVRTSGPAIVEVDMLTFGPMPPYYPFNQMKSADGKALAANSAMKTGLEVVVETLRARFSDRVTTNDTIRRQHANTLMWTKTEPPDAVVYPETTQEVSEIARLCFENGVPMIPFGIGSSFEGQVNAPKGGLSIDTSRMNACLAVHEADMDCVVQPGITRKALNAHLRDKGLMFPVDPGADASIGGMVGTRASGTNAVRYGTMKDNVICLEVVLPNGDIVRTARRAKKSSSGYDLTRLFVGSEGTLGIVTEITLRLFGIPTATAAAVCTFPSIRAACDAAITTIQAGIPIARIEFLDEMQVRGCNLHAGLNLEEKPMLFLEFHGTDDGVEEQSRLFDEIAKEFGGSSFQWATETEKRARLWQARHDALWAAMVLKPGATPISTDVCVPLSSLAECVEQTRADLDESGILATITGHVGDGNFHVVLLIDMDDVESRRSAELFLDRIVRRALAMEGTCSGEHGIGQMKRKYLVAEHGDAAMRLMAAIKRAVDPTGVMNPGKILPDDLLGGLS